MATKKAVSDGVKAVTLLLSILVLGACTIDSSHMHDVAPNEADYSLRADEALVVFMRPHSYGGTVQSSLFDISSGAPEFIGILSAKTKIAHYAAPGEKMFMVIGENADFLRATLDPDKVYYALVEARVGLWKARFGMRPVNPTWVTESQFAWWWNETRWVENGPSAKGWADANMASVREKMADYLPDWEAQEDKPTLAADDGETALYQPPQ